MSTYHPNNLFANRYLLLEKIGLGGFSEVWKAQDQMAEDTVVAIKIYAPERGMDELGLKQFRREYAVVLNLNHRHLLTARHFDVYNGSPYLVMPFINGGSVYSDMMEHGPWSEEKMAKLISQMAEALDFLHDNDVLHQDIKPDNILIDTRGNYLLTDFGISSRLRSSLRKSTTTATAMTVAYAPPERFHGTQEAQEAGDIFSFGVLLYELSVGDVPWMGAGGVVVKADSDPIALPDTYSKRFQQLVQACLRFDVSQRPTAETLQKWAAEFSREGAWPEIPAASIAVSSDEGPKRGRSTQRMDEIPAEQLAPASEQKNKGKEAATMKQGSGAVGTTPEKKGKGAMIAIIAVVLVLGAAGAFFFLNKGEEAMADEPSKAKMAYDSLIHIGDSLFDLQDLLAAKAAYEKALVIMPEDSAAIAALSKFDNLLANNEVGDSSNKISEPIEEPTKVVVTEPAKTEPKTTPIKQEPVRQEPVRQEPKKPTEDELRQILIDEMKGQGGGGTKYDLTGQTSIAGGNYNYSGAVKNGKANGYGVGYFTNGNRYEGNWVDGQREGNGTYYFEDGTKYVGEYKDDRFNGRGKMTWEDGDTYEGSYKSGQRHGLGTYTTNNGSLNNCPDCVKYQGYWKENDKYGFGKCYDKYGTLLYDGDFRDGKPTGRYPNR